VVQQESSLSDPLIDLRAQRAETRAASPGPRSVCRTAPPPLAIAGQLPAGHVLVADSESPPRAGLPWWLWCNVLSLDAPVVAVAWAWLFARANGHDLSRVDAGVLILAVWIIYTCDRLVDGWRAGRDEVLQARHEFCLRHRTLLTILVAAASLLIFYLAVRRLPAAEVRAGTILGLLVALYMGKVHAVRRGTSWSFPKELLVGLLFSLGVALPCWSEDAQFPRGLVFPGILFALLCSLNCLAIECWENRGRRVSGSRFQATLAWAEEHINSMAGVLTTAAFFAAFSSSTNKAATGLRLAAGFASLSLLLLNSRSAKLSSPVLRVLADVALLAPVVPLVVILRLGR
jgi:hypothetical protein